MQAATNGGDGGNGSARFGAAMVVAHDAISYEPTVFEPENFVDWASPGRDSNDGVVETLAWVLNPQWLVLDAAIEAERLNDEDGAAPVPDRTARAFLFGRGDEGDDDPAFVVRGSFVNRWDDERVAVETPAPWETPDDMTPGNDIVKSLEWDDYHYSFESDAPEVGAENVWLVDAEGVEPLREAAEEAGYEWVEDTESEPSEDVESLVEAARFLRAGEIERENYTLVGGDRVVVRYESKQTGNVMEKAGMVNSTSHSGDRIGFAFERDDGKTNRVMADDGEVGIYSTSQYPFMGTVVSVEVEPAE